MKMFQIAALAVLVLVMNSCVKSTTPPVVERAETYISVLQMASLVPSADIYINDQIASRDLTNGRAFPYSPLDPGLKAAKFKKAGSDSLIATVDVALYDTSKFHTWILYNDLSGTSAKAVSIRDDFSVVTADKAFCRFYNMSSEPGAIDFVFNSDIVSPARTYADNTTNSLMNEFKGFQAGTVVMKIRKNGETVSLLESTRSITNGNAFTVILTGRVGGIGDNELKINVLQAAVY